VFVTALPGRRALRTLLRAVSRHRLLLAAGLAAGSVATGLSVVAPDAPRSARVLTVTRDLPAGTAVTASDVRSTSVPVGLQPTGALREPDQVVGRLVAGPVRRGEALTDVRLLGAALLPPGSQVALPVRLTEPATAALVVAGDRVDVLWAAPDGAATAQVVAAGLQVLAVPDLDGTGEGALLVVAASRPAAARLAAAAVTGSLSVVVLGR
jgi:Flp pilus assembly protein CpaB